MLPDLLLYPAFDHVKTGTRMSDPKVVHPTTQNRIDFRNHNLHGPADVLSEDLPELFKQRRPLLQLGRIVWSPAGHPRAGATLVYPAPLIATNRSGTPVADSQ